MKQIVIVLGFLMLVACAPEKKPESAPVPEGSKPIPSKTVVRCGDTIVSAAGMAFRVNINTGEIFLLDDGIYGYPKVCNGWGCTPECYYEILKGEVVP